MAVAIIIIEATVALTCRLSWLRASSLQSVFRPPSVWSTKCFPWRQSAGVPTNTATWSRSKVPQRGSLAAIRRLSLPIILITLAKMGHNRGMPKTFLSAPTRSRRRPCHLNFHFQDLCPPLFPAWGNTVPIATCLASLGTIRGPNMVPCTTVSTKNHHGHLCLPVDIYHHHQEHLHRAHLIRRHRYIPQGHGSSHQARVCRAYRAGLTQ